jgi:anti-sigma factor RsiW
MNPDPNYERLREIGWRRPLTEAEQAELREWLATHPEHHSDAEVEAALTQALANLPEAPMPSNFTSRVLQAVERETQATERGPRPVRATWWRAFIPRIAVATLIVGITGFSYWRHQAEKQAELVDAAKNLVTVDPEALEDFEAIRHLSQADDGLLALSDDLLSLK